MPEIKLAQGLDKTVVGWIVKVVFNGRLEGDFSKHEGRQNFI